MIAFPSKFQYRPDVSLSENGIKKFSNVLIAGERAVVVSVENSEIIYCKGREHQMKSTIPKVIYWDKIVEKEFLCFPGFNHCNWYHVLTDIGFQIFLAKQLGLADTFVLPARVKTVSQSFMQFFNLFGMKILFIDHPRKAIKANNVVCFDRKTGRLSEAMRGGLLDKEINGYFDFLYQCFLESEWAEKTNYGDKIFSTRTGSDSRVYEKLSEIENEYQGLGYQVIHFDGMSFFEQIALMQNVTHFAGFHGANLTNMIFARKCQQLVELVNIELSDDFKTIAQFIGLSYRRRKLI